MTASDPTINLSNILLNAETLCWASTNPQSGALIGAYDLRGNGISKISNTVVFGNIKLPYCSDLSKMKALTLSANPSSTSHFAYENNYYNVTINSQQGVCEYKRRMNITAPSESSWTWVMFKENLLPKEILAIGVHLTPCPNPAEVLSERGYTNYVSSDII